MKFIYLIFLFTCVCAQTIKAQQSSAIKDSVVYVFNSAGNGMGIKLKKASNLTQAIKEANKTIPDSKVMSVKIYRLIPQTSDRTIFTIDLKAVKTNKTENLTLQLDDILVLMPQKKVKKRAKNAGNQDYYL